VKVWLEENKIIIEKGIGAIKMKFNTLQTSKANNFRIYTKRIGPLQSFQVWEGQNLIAMIEAHHQEMMNDNE